ncbi:hypothetical protein JRQ81_010380 [Phrynocephalus forsythii]|uniref:Uncharacterized protein n=1 Tax=Phrynocephalus forsythii TaxID=171643 RepID=A0A9Q1ARA0_9SAUR|nr:hypothetical protein JRQ81_010380 [Phrynocephalus forsythii]
MMDEEETRQDSVDGPGFSEKTLPQREESSSGGVQEPPRDPAVPEPPATETAPWPNPSVHNHLVLDIDHETESTAL